MSEKDVITIKEKIKIIEEFSKTKQEMNGQTVFKGYPVGKWAINIRYAIKKGRKFSDEELKILDSCGILESGKESTIDEKIEALVKWRKEHNDIELTTYSIREDIMNKLKDYAKSSGENFLNLKEQYMKLQKYYKYVLHRQSIGLLTEEQSKKCKEGNLSKKFGYSIEIEQQAKKYRKKRRRNI